MQTNFFLPKMICQKTVFSEQKISTTNSYMLNNMFRCFSFHMYVLCGEKNKKS